MRESLSVHPVNRKIGTWLKVARLNANVPLKEAAYAIDIDEHSLEMIEAGKISARCDSIAALVRLFRVPPEQLMELLINVQIPRRPN